MYSKEHLEALLNGPHGNRYCRNIAHVECLKASISHGEKEEVSSLDKVQDAERNADKVDADSEKKAADVKEKEDTEARKVQEEKRQKELEEASIAAELLEKEAAEATNAEEEWRKKEVEEARIAAEMQEQEQQVRLNAGAVIREDDEKKRQVGDDKIKKRGRGCHRKVEKKNENDSKQGHSNESEGFFTPVGA